jgi:hypothetical protein
MNAQSRRCVLANVALNTPPATAMPNARKIWAKIKSVCALILIANHSQLKWRLKLCASIIFKKAQRIVAKFHGTIFWKITISYHHIQMR